LRNGFTPLAKTIFLQSGKEITLEVTLSANTEENFLAKIIKPSQKDLDSFHDALKSFDEPDFCSESILKQGYESYRFLWQRTFHHPVLIQLTRKSSNNATLIYKELDVEKGEYKYGSLIEKKSVDVYKFMGRSDQPADLVQGAVKALFEEAKKQVWDQPFALVETFRPDGDISIITDGSAWTIEATKDEKCHLVIQETPDKDPVRFFGETLINISGKRFYYDEFY
jgi:hypothetical protein